MCVCSTFTCGSPDNVNWSHQKEDFSLPSLQSAKEKKNQSRIYHFTQSHFSRNPTIGYILSEQTVAIATVINTAVITVTAAQRCGCNYKCAAVVIKAAG